MAHPRKCDFFSTFMFADPPNPGHILPPMCMNMCLCYSTETISLAHSLGEAAGNEARGLLQLKPQDTVRITSKSAGSVPELWGGEVRYLGTHNRYQNGSNLYAKWSSSLSVQ